MDYQPKKLITKVLEFAAVFALAAYLIRLGVGFIFAVWPVLIALAIVTIGSIVGFRIWKTKAKW